MKRRAYEFKERMMKSSSQQPQKVSALEPRPFAPSVQRETQLPNEQEQPKRDVNLLEMPHLFESQTQDSNLVIQRCLDLDESSWGETSVSWLTGYNAETEKAKLQEAFKNLKSAIAQLKELASQLQDNRFNSQIEQLQNFLEKTKNQKQITYKQGQELLKEISTKKSEANTLQEQVKKAIVEQKQKEEEEKRKRQEEEERKQREEKERKLKEEKERKQREEEERKLKEEEERKQREEEERKHQEEEEKKKQREEKKKKKAEEKRKRKEEEKRKKAEEEERTKEEQRQQYLAKQEELKKQREEEEKKRKEAQAKREEEERQRKEEEEEKRKIEEERKNERRTQLQTEAKQIVDWVGKTQNEDSAIGDLSKAYISAYDRAMKKITGKEEEADRLVIEEFTKLIPTVQSIYKALNGISPIELKTALGNLFIQSEYKSLRTRICSENGLNTQTVDMTNQVVKETQKILEFYQKIDKINQDFQQLKQNDKYQKTEWRAKAETAVDTLIHQKDGWDKRQLGQEISKALEHVVSYQKWYEKKVNAEKQQEAYAQTVEGQLIEFISKNKKKEVITELERLVKENQVEQGKISRAYISTNWDSQHLQEFSIEFPLEIGKEKYKNVVVHVHCDSEGNAKKGNAAHFKLSNQKYLGETWELSEELREKLLPSAEQMQWQCEKDGLYK